MIFLYAFFAIIASITLLISLSKLIQIINFNIKMKKNYYKEIQGSFDTFFWNKGNNSQELIFGKSYATPIFTYKIGKEEFIYRGIKVIPSKYKKGQKVTLYQNPKNGKIFENPYNAKSEIISFFIASLASILLIIFVLCVNKI